MTVRFSVAALFVFTRTTVEGQITRRDCFEQNIPGVTECTCVVDFVVFTEGYYEKASNLRALSYRLTIICYTTVRQRICVVQLRSLCQVQELNIRTSKGQMGPVVAVTLVIY